MYAIVGEGKDVGLASGKSTRKWERHLGGGVDQEEK